MNKFIKIILIVTFPLIFTLILINGLYNFAGNSGNFYLFFALAAPFLIVIFGGLCKIVLEIVRRTGFF